jgi:alpha-L-fucosidase 2
LTDPFFDMYVNQLPDAAKAARQRWGVEGAYFLEAGPFDGPVVLPDEIGREYQDVYLGRKTTSDFSPAALALGQYECILTQFADGHEFRGEAGRYSFCSHMASSGSELASHAWWRYRYTGDKQWLATHAYPLLKGTVEFYRGLAGTDEAAKLKETDGKYHLYGLNQHEAYWGVNDGLTDLAAIRGTAPLAIRAAEILGVDAALRAKWKEFLDNLTPYPMGSDPQSVGVVEPDIWSIGHKGPSNHVQPDPGEGLMWPIFPFEDWTLETRDPETGRIAHKFAEVNSFRVSMLTDEPWGAAIFGSATHTPIVGSRTGRGEDLSAILASYYFHYNTLPNGFSEFEGQTAQSIEQLGSISTATNEALLQSVSARPGQPEVISVFTAWPQSWDAAYRLAARGGFLVSSAIQKGKVEFVELQSRRGETCRLRNPWGEACVVTQVDGPSQVLEGELLRFDTVAGKRYRVFQQGTPPPAAWLVQAQPTGRPWSYATTLPGGKQVTATVGIPRGKMISSSASTTRWR